jgi:orotidine-5'-phosphate decarboxylase
MVPAIRPAWSVPNDQKNFTTPTEAIQRGATYIVVGRPITEQYKMTGDAQLAAFRAVEQEVKEAL